MTVAELIRALQLQEDQKAEVYIGITTSDSDFLVGRGTDVPQEEGWEDPEDGTARVVISALEYRKETVSRGSDYVVGKWKSL